MLPSISCSATLLVRHIQRFHLAGAAYSVVGSSQCGFPAPGLPPIRMALPVTTPPRRLVRANGPKTGVENAAKPLHGPISSSDPATGYFRQQPPRQLGYATAGDAARRNFPVFQHDRRQPSPLPARIIGPHSMKTEGARFGSFASGVLLVSKLVPPAGMTG